MPSLSLSLSILIYIYYVKFFPYGTIVCIIITVTSDVMTIGVRSECKVRV